MEDTNQRLINGGSVDLPLASEVMSSDLVTAVYKKEPDILATECLICRFLCSSQWLSKASMRSIRSRIGQIHP